VDGHEIVVDPNTSMELEGFMHGVTVCSRFKFIHKTKEIAEYRGDRIDDGIVRVEFRFEKKVETTEHVVHHTHVHDYPWWHWNWYEPYYPTYPPRPTVIYSDNTRYTNNLIGSAGSFASCSSDQSTSGGLHVPEPTASAFCNFAAPTPSPNPDEGITVQGSGMHQEFAPVYVGEMETDSTVITIRLVGVDTSGKWVKDSVTIKDKLKCPTCGKISGSDSLFCNRCGAHLGIPTIDT
jgi:hypothetical protein